jgi:hypothetical protein
MEWAWDYFGGSRGDAVLDRTEDISDTYGRLRFQRCALPAICRSPWAKTRNEIIRVGVLQFFIAARFVNLAVSLPQYQFASHRLSFLVPGVVSPDLPSEFAHSAAYGDIIAATLALLSLLLLQRASGVVTAWVFNLWGTADLLNAFYHANHAGLLAVQLGATYFIPTVVVPLLFITRDSLSAFLLQHQSESVVRENRHSP